MATELQRSGPMPKVAPPPTAWPVIVLVGLAFEARIAAGPDAFVVCRGPHCEPSTLLQFALRDGCRSILSFGVAGGLAPNLVPGDCVVASAIIDAQIMRPTDPVWSRRLLAMIPDARHGPVIGVDAVVSEPVAKRQLHAITGAVAVDMESHLVARLAARHGLALASVRVVVDPAHRAVPRAALAAWGSGGNTALYALAREIMAQPSQLSELMRIAADGFAARAALLRLRRKLGPGLGFLR